MTKFTYKEKTFWNIDIELTQPLQRPSITKIMENSKTTFQCYLYLMKLMQNG